MSSHIQQVHVSHSVTYNAYGLGQDGKCVLCCRLLGQDGKCVLCCILWGRMTSVCYVADCWIENPFGTRYYKEPQQYALAPFLLGLLSSLTCHSVRGSEVSSSTRRAPPMTLSASRRPPGAR